MNLGGPPPPGFVPLMGGHFKGPPPREERLYDKERRRKLRCIYSRIPWIKHGSLRLPGVLGLHQEIEDFYAWMLPTTLEHAVRLDVVERIRSAINELYPAARVEISGSFRTGLYLPTSDIDLVICGKWESLPLRTIERVLLEKKIASPDSLRVLDKAAVPIVKLTDIRSDIKVDISFNMSNGVRAAELIKHFKKLYPSLPKLIYVLKQFLLQRDLNEVFTGGLSSYSLILLVISYLQHHYSQETASSGRANLGVMLIEILELYGRNFNFMNTAIRITDGGSYISKTKFQKVIANGYAPALLSIEDPLDHTNDVGRSSYGFVTVQNSFDRAFAVLTSLVVAQASIPDGKSILNSIVEIPEDVSDYRSWMRETFTFLGSPHNYNNFTFPAVPPQFYRVPLECVTPKELPGYRLHPREQKEQLPQHSQSPAAPVVHNNGNDLSDCLSSVSTGTCPSHSSPLDSLSDTDSEVLIGPTLTPHSAMSISPANSEIGSSIGKFSSSKSGSERKSETTPKRTSSKVLDTTQKRCPSASSTSSRGSTSGRHSDATANGALLLGGTFKHPSSVVNSHHKQHPPPSSHHSKTRPPVNRNSSSKHSSQKDVGRSDSVMNWRSPERRKKVFLNNSDKPPTSQSFDTSKTNTNTASPKVPSPSVPLNHSHDSRADRDSNWREREQPRDRDRNGNSNNNNINNVNNQHNNNIINNDSVQNIYHSHQNLTTANNNNNSSNNNNNANANNNSHHYSVNNGGTPVKQKKKHKKNHNKSSFKYNHQKVKENEKCIDSKDNNSCYPSLEGKESSQQPQQQHQPPPSVPHHRNHQSMNKSSTKKRKKAHLNKGGGGLSSPTSPQQIDSMVVVSEINKSIVINASHHHPHHQPPSSVSLHQHHSSSRFSPKAQLGNGKR
uniref:polynucleotide adenylyltransferase n=1 Tax=Lepeophtheirus salmonis TaxID=72036 RepID=A0A0K2UNL3_LEPSM